MVEGRSQKVPSLRPPSENGCTLSRDRGARLGVDRGPGTLLAAWDVRQRDPTRLAAVGKSCPGQRMDMVRALMLCSPKKNCISDRPPSAPCTPGTHLLFSCCAESTPTRVGHVGVSLTYIHGSMDNWYCRSSNHTPNNETSRFQSPSTSTGQYPCPTIGTPLLTDPLRHSSLAEFGDHPWPRTWTPNHPQKGGLFNVDVHCCVVTGATPSSVEIQLGVNKTNSTFAISSNQPHEHTRRT